MPVPRTPKSHWGTEGEPVCIPARTVGCTAGEEPLSWGKLNLCKTVGPLVFTLERDTTSPFQGYSLQKHLWKNSLKQRQYLFFQDVHEYKRHMGDYL